MSARTGNDQALHTQATQGQTLHLRGDWFVFAASKPPLYHQVLNLPDTAQALEQSLGINVERNIAGRTVKRAGFQNSGVALNNRVIEQHVPANSARRHAYWRSYDFLDGQAEGDRKRQIVSNPTDFEADAGEIIFNLPNGLQAYLLVNAQGRRIDAAPVDVARDTHVRRDGNSVLNGISCMACHAAGMIRKNDEIREHVRHFAEQFSAEVRELVDRLYPAQNELNSAFAQGEQVFAEALRQLGIEPRTNEPIISTYLNFEGPMNRQLVAAELGLTLEDLTTRVRQFPQLGARLGLSPSVQQIPRSGFNSNFRAIASSLRDGRAPEFQRPPANPRPYW